jgi:hypothetical protein
LAEPSGAPHLIPQVDQAARDSDRVEILRQELKKSETLLEALARRKGDRLAASDPVGATEVEEEYGRTLSDIAGLKRELAFVTRTATPTSAHTSPSPSAAAKSGATRSPAAAKAPATTPWWDVYGKGRGAESATSISLAPPSEATPRPGSAR